MWVIIKYCTISILLYTPVTPSTLNLSACAAYILHTGRFVAKKLSIYSKCDPAAQRSFLCCRRWRHLSGSYKPQPPWCLHSWTRPRWSCCCCCTLWKEHFIQAGRTRLLYIPTQHAGHTQRLSVDQLGEVSSCRHDVSEKRCIGLH